MQTALLDEETPEQSSSKTLKVTRLAARAFKGIASHDTKPTGDITVAGRNGLGKTTVQDIFFYTLTGKDSQGKADFEIKPLDAQNKAATGEEHWTCVEFTDAQGNSTSFERIYKEKWETTRGKATKEFKGHETTYYVNTVPLLKKEFDAKITGLVGDPLNVFLLSSPSAFNTALPWEKRRAKLMELFGDVSDAEVIANNPALHDLPGILTQHTVAEYRKIAESTKKKVAEEYKEIPIKIRTITEGLPEATSGDVQPQIQKITAELDDLRSQRATTIAGGATATKTARKTELESEILAEKNKIRAALGNDYETAQQAVRECQSRINAKQSELDSLTHDISNIDLSIQQKKARYESLTSEFTAESEKAFTWTGVDICSSCNQPLPADKVAAAKANAEANFNQAKSQNLERITAQRKAILEEHQQYKVNKATKEEAKAALESQLRGIEDEYEQLVEKADSLTAPTVDFEAYESITSRMYEINQLQTEIVELQTSIASELQKLDTAISNKSSRIQSLNAQAEQAKRRESELLRIEELKKREKELAGEIEKLEKALNLCELFVQEKAKHLTEKINSNFEIARFKLFNPLINGGIEECCETLVEGVPYSSNVNTGAKINVGLDIIATFQRVLGLELPIFIDNAESVSELYATDAQQIAALHDPQVEELRVIEGNLETARQTLKVERQQA